MKDNCLLIHHSSVLAHRFPLSFREVPEAAAQKEFDREVTAFIDGALERLLGGGLLVAEIEQGRERVFARRLFGGGGAGRSARGRLLVEPRRGELRHLVAQLD